mmetsp:Transcript_22981/g.38483  ORF Transcript_22981/g.38483 Transcript_22981/m.38483 type:complete len:287 (+) Transcript_22981:632-1492(+)
MTCYMLLVATDVFAFVHVKNNLCNVLFWSLSMRRMQRCWVVFNCGVSSISVTLTSDCKKLKRLVIPNPNEEQMNKMKQMFRFHIVRWTPRETLQGHETLTDDSKCKSAEGMKSPALFELDFCKHMNDNNFLEFSVICDSRNSKGQKLDNVPCDAKQTLLNDIHKCTTEGQHFKVLKRRFSLLRCECVFEKKKSDESKSIVPSKMPNGNLGNLHQVEALVDNLLFLAENFNDSNKDGMNKSIDDIMDKLSFASLSKFAMEEDDIMNDSKMMLKGKSIGDVSGNLVVQ